MRWLNRLLVMVVVVGSTTLWAAGGVLPGGGTEGDPYLIEDLADFDAFAGDPNYWASGVYTTLACDPNLAGRPYTAAVIAPDTSVSDGFQGSKFTGVFDGNGHRIMNLTIDDSGAGNDYLGLFGSVDYGQIKNLGVEGGFVSGYKLVGGLAGHNTGEIWNCYFSGPVSGTDYDVGGLVGHNGGEIWNCYSTGPVTGTDYDVGGLVGHNNGSVSNCYSTGDVSGNWYVGGLVGWNDNGSVSNCYCTGDVNGASDVGGLVGNNDNGSVLNCYSTGDVSGNLIVGGLVAINDGEVSNCFWDIETSGMTDGVGNQTPEPAGATGKTTAQMQVLSTFVDADWDFINVWNIGENQTYPYIRTYSAADINKDRVVNVIDLSIMGEQWMRQ